MTQSQKYLVSLIKKLALTFDSMSFAYGFDSIANQHIVEVQPNSMFESDEYLEVESDIVSEFSNKFPEEGLLFTCDNPTIFISDVIYNSSQKLKTKLPSKQFINK
jgi:hypothetical protein